MKNLAFIIIVLICFNISSVNATDLPDDTIVKITKILHDKMAGAMIGDGHIITPEEAAGLKYPLIPNEISEKTLLRGYISGFSEVCGLEWKTKSFLPYMKSIRIDNPNWNDYQYAFVGIVHGYAQENATTEITNKQCTDRVKSHLEKNLY